MRRIAALAGMLVLVAGCGRINPQQDTLAPRVAPPQAPVPLTGNPGPSPAPDLVSAAGSGSVPARGSGQAAAAAQGAPQVSASGQAASAPSAAAQSARPSAGAGGNASSQPARSVPASAPASPQATSTTPLPTASRALLQPMQHEFETWNNCAPVTAEMVLSYYGISKRQTEIAPVLRPHPKNFSVRMDQIAAYLSQFGLHGQPLIGGALAELKALISNGIPVVVEDQLSLQDDYGHFRVARGFDDGAGVIIFGDSYFGAANRIGYAQYQELWKRHNYAFMPVYRPEQRPLVQAVLGRDFDPEQNQAHALADARQAVAGRPDDGFAWMNLGSDLYRAGQLAEAKDAWERARKLQLTGRTLWYTIWPAAVYNRLGEYQRALDVVAIPLATDPFNAEALLERGNAYRGLGNKDRARADYSLAAEVDPSLLPARQALASI